MNVPFADSWRAVALVTTLVGTTVLGACGTQVPSHSLEPQPSKSHAPTAAPIDSGSPRPVAQRDEIWDWRQLESMPLRVNNPTASGAFDGRYLVDVTQSHSGSAVVVDTRTAEVVVDHHVVDSDAGWHTADAWLMEPWLLLTEDNASDPGAEPVRVFRYDLHSGEVVDVTAIQGLPAPSLVWSGADGMAIFDTSYPSRLVACLEVLDVAALTWTERWCGPRDWHVGWARLGPGETITFRLQEEPKGGVEPCVRLYRLPLLDSEPRELPLRDSCKAFSGAGGSDWTAWSEVGLHDQNIQDSRGFAQLPDGSVVSLGYVATGSISACGEWVYWQGREIEDPVSRPKATLVRWRPGEDAQVIFKAPQDALLGRQECAGGWVTIMVAASGGTETVLAAKAPD